MQTTDTFDSVIQPRLPLNPPDWHSVPTPPIAQFNQGFPVKVWFHQPQALFVFSSVEVADGAATHEAIPQYHLSISKSQNNKVERCTSSEADFVLRAFGMEDAEEDNHVPFGKVRNFWLPVADKYKGSVCPCKDEEIAVREEKGDYVWRPAP